MYNELNKEIVMNKMKNILTKITIALILVFVANGCVSYPAYQSNRKHLALRMARERGDETRVRAIQNDEELEENVPFWDVIKERFGLTSAAAIADALMTFGAVEGVKWLKDELGCNDKSNVDSTAKDGLEIPSEQIPLDIQPTIVIINNNIYITNPTP